MKGENIVLYEVIYGYKTQRWREEREGSWVYITQKRNDALYISIYISKPYQFNIN